MRKLIKQVSIREERSSNSTLHDNKHNTNNIIVINKQQGYMEHGQHRQHHQPADSKQQDVKIEYDPIVPEAGRLTKLIISVKEKSGDPVREYELVHEKLMHLIIVGDDLSYFSHIHPILENKGENFVISHTFPEAGKYKLWVDFKPKGGIQNVLAFMVDVKGLPAHNAVLPVHDGIYNKESSDRNYHISLNLSQEHIVANKDLDIVFSIYDAAGNPVMDLETLMGAGGHSVIISSDIQEFLHVHPTEEVEPTWKGGPHISFRTIFPKSGLYKVWGQFQHRGKIIMADFILKVS
jgi:hypothetical protein